MKYNYRHGAKADKKHTKAWLVLPLLGLLVGGYSLLNTYSPAIATPFGTPADAVANKLRSEQPAEGDDRLYIPKINVDIALHAGDEITALELGAWHNLPESGDPVVGGNFVVSAIRYKLGLTPMETREKSPFYRLDMLKEGDEVYVDYDGVRYAYNVTRRYVANDITTEASKITDNDRFMLYASGPNGGPDGDEIIEAKPVGTIAWVKGAPKLKSLN